MYSLENTVSFNSALRQFAEKRRKLTTRCRRYVFLTILAAFLAVQFLSCIFLTPSNGSELKNLHHSGRFKLSDHIGVDKGTEHEPNLKNLSEIPDRYHVLREPLFPSDHYAIIACSTPEELNYNYAFNLPITVKTWERIGFGAGVILIGDEDIWDKRPALRTIFDELKSTGAGIAFIEAKPQSFALLGQTARLFGANIFNWGHSDVFLTTTDVDLWPITTEGDFYRVPKDKEVKILHAECCGYFDHRGKSVKMFPMAHVIMTHRRWAEVMNGQRSYPVKSGRDILRYLMEDFGDDVLWLESKRGNQLWYTDQKVMSIRLGEWIESGNNHDRVLKQSRPTEFNADLGIPIPTDRIDRANWILPKSLENIVDAHLISNGYLEENWSSHILPLLALMFDKVEAEVINQYRSAFIDSLRQEKYSFSR